MKAFDRIHRHPSRAELARFGATFAAGFVVLGLVSRFGLHRPGTARAMWIAAAVGLVLAFVPKLDRWFYVAWMGLGVAIGTVTSPIVLGVVYLVLFTPLALWFRIIGRDAMRRRLDRDATTYWEPHEPPDRRERYFDPY